jgi:hypothetical protein
MYLFNLALAHRVRFEERGSTDDLDAAVALGGRAVDGTAAGDIGLAMRLSTLGGALRQRFEHLGRVEDLVEADRLGRRPSLADPGDPTEPCTCRTALTLRTRASGLGRRHLAGRHLARAAVSAARDRPLLPTCQSRAGCGFTSAPDPAAT